jgi:hypothetical protein
MRQLGLELLTIVIAGILPALILLLVSSVNYYVLYLVKYFIPYFFAPILYFNLSPFVLKKIKIIS